MLPVFAWCALGLNWTSRPVLVVQKFSNVQIPDFRCFLLLDSRYLTFNDWWDFRAISHSKFLQPVLNQDKSWTKTSHEPRPVMNPDQFKWGNLSMHMYGLSIEIGKGLWTRIWIQKFIIVVDLKKNPSTIYILHRKWRVEKCNAGTKLRFFIMVTK